MVDEQGTTRSYTSSGVSGTDYSGNQFFEDYLDALHSIEGPKTFDEMRRSDDQITMLLRIVKNPIMGARWYIEPASEDEEDKKVSDFVEFVLFEDMGTADHPKSFEKFKRESLTCVDFGYSLFEIVDKICFDHPEHKNYIGLKGLNWRSPKTIDEWFISRSGILEKVRQYDYSQRGGAYEIDGKCLLHIAPEMEGDNFEGISMLRPIYGNWLRKDFLRKLQMIGVERAATGVPIGEIPHGQENSPSQAALEDSLSRFVSHERQYLVTPEGFPINELKITHDAEKVAKAIDQENVGMTKSFLANFLELGMGGGGGSYALGTDLSDIFLSGIEVYSNSVTTSVNMKAIPHICRANFRDIKKFPELKIEGINDKAGKEFAEVLKILGESGMIQITERLKSAVHKKYKLPEYDPGAEEITPPEPQSMIFSLSEKSVGSSIEKTGKEFTGVLQIGMKPRALDLVNKMIRIWKNEPSSRRMAEVNKLKVPGRTEFKKQISEYLAGVYVKSTDGVKKELGIDGLKLAEPTQAEIKALPVESKAAGKSQAELLVDSMDADLRKSLFFSFTANADKLPTEAQMEANLISVVEKYLNGPSVLTAGPNAVANAVNLARNAIYQKKETLDKIESFVFMNPSPEAPICKELAGRVFTKEEYIVSDKLPPLHHHCNSWIKAQVTGRKGNKSLSPAGLSIQGTPNQIEQIEKSIKF